MNWEDNSGAFGLSEEWLDSTNFNLFWTIPQWNKNLVSSSRFFKTTWFTRFTHFEPVSRYEFESWGHCVCKYGPACTWIIISSNCLDPDSSLWQLSDMIHTWFTVFGDSFAHHGHHINYRRSPISFQYHIIPQESIFMFVINWINSFRCPISINDTSAPLIMCKTIRAMITVDV